MANRDLVSEGPHRGQAPNQGLGRPRMASRVGGEKGDGPAAGRRLLWSSLVHKGGHGVAGQFP
eukprot:15379224-Alexandrium_andersonii.AAC.1